MDIDEKLSALDTGSRIEFRKVHLKNLDEIIELSVRQSQADLVADNLYSIAQAGLDPLGLCRAVYLDGKPAGFFSLKKLDGGTRIYIWRFMIDQRFQGIGLGRRTMMHLLDRLFAVSNVKIVDLAVSRILGGAEVFYHKCGFTATGESYGGGWRMTLAKESYRQSG